MNINKKLLGLLAIGLVSMMAITACDPSTMNPKDAPVSIYTEVEEETSFDLLATPDTFEDATYSQEMRERPNPRHRDKRGQAIGHHPFGKLLRALDLNERQAAAAKEMLREHHDCVKAAIEIYREHMKGVFMRAREARKGIIESAKAGEITREEARDKIRALNMRVREYLNDSNIRARIKAMMDDCDNQFLRKLHSILDDDQKATLERWIMAMKDRADKREEKDDKRDDKRKERDDRKDERDEEKDDRKDDKGDDDDEEEEEDDDDDDTPGGRRG